MESVEVLDLFEELMEMRTLKDLRGNTVVIHDEFLMNEINGKYPGSSQLAEVRVFLEDLKRQKIDCLVVFSSWPFPLQQKGRPREDIEEEKRLVGLLKEMSVPFFFAPVQASAQMAYYTSEGDYTFAISSDMHTLFSGSRSMIVGYDKEMHSTVKILRASDIEKKFGSLGTIQTAFLLASVSGRPSDFPYLLGLLKQNNDDDLERLGLGLENFKSELLFRRLLISHQYVFHSRTRETTFLHPLPHRNQIIQNFKAIGLEIDKNSFGFIPLDVDQFFVQNHLPFLLPHSSLPVVAASRASLQDGGRSREKRDTTKVVKDIRTLQKEFQQLDRTLRSIDLDNLPDKGKKLIDKHREIRETIASLQNPNRSEEVADSQSLDLSDRQSHNDLEFVRKVLQDLEIASKQEQEQEKEKEPVISPATEKRRIPRRGGRRETQILEDEIERELVTVDERKARAERSLEDREVRMVKMLEFFFSNENECTYEVDSDDEPRC